MYSEQAEKKDSGQQPDRGFRDTGVRNIMAYNKGPLYNTWLLLKDIKDLWILLVISDQEEAQRQGKSSVAGKLCLMLHTMLTRPPKHTHLSAHEHVGVRIWLN